jgi:hypothetical protein
LLFRVSHRPLLSACSQSRHEVSRVLGTQSRSVRRQSWTTNTTTCTATTTSCGEVRILAWRITPHHRGKLWKLLYQILQNSESREATLISNVKSAALTFSLYVGTIQTMQLAKLRSLLCIFCCEIIGRSRIRKVVWRSTELCGRTHQGAEAATFRRNYLVIICPVAHTTEWGKLP